MAAPSPSVQATGLAALAVVGALLAFTLEPLVGRLVTLSYGGAVHVWTVCVLVFQVLLLGGYAFAHLVVRRLPWAWAALGVVALVTLPVDVTAALRPDGDVLSLIATVLRSVGLPFLVLSSASVVAQGWYDRAGLGPPWWLYGASNAASLGGLFAYPLLIEPNTALTTQRLAWSVGFVGFVGAAAALTPRAWVLPAPPRSAVPWGAVLRWAALAAAPSALLVAMTHRLTLELGSFPLLWAVPLALYLASFLLAFRDPDTPPGWMRLWPDALVFLGLLSLPIFVVHLPFHPPLHALFFLVCWWVHQRLYAARPDPAALTWFYLAIAAGGALGSAAVTLGAPLLFTGLWELPISLVACGVALWAGGAPLDPDWFRRVHVRVWGSRLALTGTAAGLLVQYARIEAGRPAVDAMRSLYGIFVVRDFEVDGQPARELVHGRTRHGAQYLDGPQHAVPMTYYHPEGGLGRAIAHRAGPRIGGIGLGTGAIAALTRPGDTLVFYEVDPHAETLARRWFTYLEDAPGEVSVRLGDARLLLAEEAAEAPYDVLLVDAFSGDGVPTHLLTAEALATYLARTAPDGLIVFHLSNRYLDLLGVVAALAEDAGLAGKAWREREAVVDDPLYAGHLAAVLARDPTRLEGLEGAWWGPLSEVPPTSLWTDERIDLLEPLGRRAGR
jgi:hypothetical protein